MDNKAQVLLAIINSGKKEVSPIEILENTSLKRNQLDKTLYQLRRQCVIQRRTEIIKGIQGGNSRAFYFIKNMKHAKYFVKRAGVEIE